LLYFPDDMPFEAWGKDKRQVWAIIVKYARTGFRN
jgi:hypothetical protein